METKYTPTLTDELVGTLYSIVATIDYSFRWLKDEQRTIERRCESQQITGAHKDCAMQSLAVVESNLNIARARAIAAIAKASEKA
jgi:hypothetical protein